MNSHQRRKVSRCRHMLLPLGKEVRLEPLLNRHVYAYGSYSRTVKIDHTAWRRMAIAIIHRHVNPRHGGGIDLLLKTQEGLEVCINTSPRGIRLKNPADRAIRPWWSSPQRRRSA